MFSIRYVRENAQTIKEGIRKKKVEIDIDLLLQKDERRRKLITEIDNLRHEQKEAGRLIGEKKQQGEDAEELINQMQEIKRRLKASEEELKKLEGEINETLKWIPNPPHPSVPEGQRVIKEWGEVKKFPFEPKDHLTLCNAHGILDFPAGARIAGSNFPLYRGKGAKLERVLINFMLDLHIEKHGYTEIFPPFLANEKCMFGTGQLPKLKEDMYLIEQDGLYLNPTAEVPLTNMYRESVIDEKDLPIKLTAYTACFRREAGSYGKETKGLMRVHQFNKVELVKFSHPENSYDELESLLQDAEEVLQLLGLPYRVVLLPYDDLSFASAKTYDIEVWAPGVGRWLEVSSVSNFEDFQARRANIRFRSGNRTEFVHTLNGSGVATPRTFIGIIENYQQEDGSIIIPEVLRKYTGFDRIP